MRENSLRNVPSTDHETMDGICPTELTRTDSHSSAITVESSHLHGNETQQGQSVEWTNEKHNAYLDLLEASFVQQLHGFMGLGGWHSREHMWGPFSSKVFSASTSSSSSSGQLMVLRDGCWQRTKSEGNETLYDNAAVNSHDGLENPLKRRGSSEQHLDCLQNAVANTTEVSDQNFVDEDQGDRSSFRPMAKRSRTAAVDASSDDQVVPIEKLQTPNIPTVNRASSEREEPAHHEVFSEHPENIASPGSNIYITS